MRPRSRIRVAALLLGLAGCENARPDTLVICHNANCAEPTDPEADDTLAALDESLALTFDGLPALDGVEIDSFWKGDEDVCLFAHDLDNAERVPATEAARALAGYIERPGPLTFSGQPFQVFIELKGSVGSSSEKHSPEQLELHAACAWSMVEILAEAATRADREVEVIVTSFEPALLLAVRRAEPAERPLRVRFAAIQGIPAPLDGQTRSLDDYAGSGIELVEIHPRWMTDAQYQAAMSADLELVFWMFDATAETFAAIDRHEPVMVETSEARLMRGWLEY
jgi:hypothetical protein